MKIIRPVDTFIKHRPSPVFGDFILFQEYKDLEYQHTLCKVTKPILVIYLGYFIADQTIGFNYVEWINENKTISITNKYVTNYKSNKQVGRINNHIEWDDFIDIIGHWDHRPSFKELLSAYRKRISTDTADIGYQDYEPHLIDVQIHLNSEQNPEVSDTTKSKGEQKAV